MPKTPPTPRAARAASFNPQHNAYNPNTQGVQNHSSRTQPSLDARANAFNPQAGSYNPTTSNSNKSN
jgi:hypothetical protein